MERTISDSEFEEYVTSPRQKNSLLLTKTIVLEAGQSIKMKKIHEFNIQIHLTNHVVYRDMQACI
jgi:hypothetical protein